MIPYGVSAVFLTAQPFLKSQAMSAKYLWCYPKLFGYYDKPMDRYKETRFMGEEIIARC